jgi:hypothetical protein
MDIAIAAAFALVMATAAVFGLLFKRMLFRDRTPDFNPEWLGGFSVTKYRPMERLLSEEDFEFLVSQEGYEPEIGKRLRSERRRIFRGYLRSIRRDFQRLETAARLFMVDSTVDQPELAKALLKQRLYFNYAVLSVEVSLALHWLGIGTVDIRHLVGSLDVMRGRLGEMALARQASVA